VRGEERVLRRPAPAWSPSCFGAVTPRMTSARSRAATSCASCAGAEAAARRIQAEQPPSEATIEALDGW